MTRLRTPFHPNPESYSVKPLKPLWLASLILPLVAVLGCEKGDDIHTYSAPKEPPPVKPVEFAVPDGWRELRPQQMQYAAFAIDPQRSDATLTIVALPRESNELAPNVNRWERELGLPPSPPEAVEKLVTHVDVGDAHVDTVDLSGTDAANGTAEPRRTLAAMVPNGTLTWFFKLKGPPDVVEKQKANFDAFVRSLKFKRDGSTPADADGHAHPQLAMAQAKAPAKEAPHDPHDGHDHSGHDHGPAQPAADARAHAARRSGRQERRSHRLPLSAQFRRAAHGEHQPLAQARGAGADDRPQGPPGAQHDRGRDAGLRL